MKDLHDTEFIEKRTKELGYKPKRQAILSRIILERFKYQTHCNLQDFVRDENVDVSSEVVKKMCKVVCDTLCEVARFDPDVTYYTPNTMTNMQKYNQKIADEFDVPIFVAQRGRSYCERFVKEREEKESNAISKDT